MKIFVSHVTASARFAVRFKEIVEGNTTGTKVYLSSDWESIPTGANWLQEIEKALMECHFFVVLMVEPSDAKNLWINYEIGFARARGILPKIFLFHQVEPRHFEYPLSGLHLLKTGDTNRWLRELDQMGVKISEEVERALADVFEKKI